MDVTTGGMNDGQAETSSQILSQTWSQRCYWCAPQEIVCDNQTVSKTLIFAKLTLQRMDDRFTLIFYMERVGVELTNQNPRHSFKYLQSVKPDE